MSGWTVSREDKAPCAETVDIFTQEYLTGPDDKTVTLSKDGHSWCFDAAGLVNWYEENAYVLTNPATRHIVDDQHIVDEVYRAAGLTPLSELSPEEKRAKIAEIDDAIRQGEARGGDDFVGMLQLGRRRDALMRMFQFDDCARYIISDEVLDEWDAEDRDILRARLTFDREEMVVAAVEDDPRARGRARVRDAEDVALIRTLSRRLEKFKHDYEECVPVPHDGPANEKDLLLNYLRENDGFFNRYMKLLRLIALLIIENRPSRQSMRLILASFESGDDFSVIVMSCFLWEISDGRGGPSWFNEVRFLVRQVVTTVTGQMESTLDDAAYIAEEYRTQTVGSSIRDNNADRGASVYIDDVHLFKPAVARELMLFYYYADACPIDAETDTHGSGGLVELHARLGYMVPRDIIIHKMMRFNDQLSPHRQRLLGTSRWYVFYRLQFVKLYDALMDPANQGPPPDRRRSAIQGVERRVRPRR